MKPRKSTQSIEFIIRGNEDNFFFFFFFSFFFFLELFLEHKSTVSCVFFGHGAWLAVSERDCVLNAQTLVELEVVVKDVRHLRVLWDDHAVTTLSCHGEGDRVG